MRSRFVSEFLESLAVYAGLWLAVFVLQIAISNRTEIEGASSGFGLAYALLITGALGGVMLALLLVRFRYAVREGVRDLASVLQSPGATTAHFAPFLRSKIPYILTYVAIVAAYLGIGFLVKAFASLLASLIKVDPDRYSLLYMLIWIIDNFLWWAVVAAIMVQGARSTMNLRADLLAARGRIVAVSLGTDSTLQHHDLKDRHSSISTHNRNYFSILHSHRRSHQLDHKDGQGTETP